MYRRLMKLLKVFAKMECYIFIDFIIGTHRSEMEVYGTNEVKQFCKVTSINMMDKNHEWIIRNGLHLITTI